MQYRLWADAQGTPYASEFFDRGDPDHTGPAVGTYTKSLAEIVTVSDGDQSSTDDVTITIVAGHAPLTLQATKEALLRLRPTIPHGEGNDLVLMCYMSEDFREGMDAFLAKRKPVWRGR